ncbi:MAG: BadF/BadG/BcrA/BcrD ATPase family protein [Gammaproteobacteria bacterium]|nr:BadF/BadG/BcrA/BcrD ATPase family protein [Gammaproteobacteria bacterium]
MIKTGLPRPNAPRARNDGALDYFVGVDGGATRATVRIENAAGEKCAVAMSGPANIRLSVEETWSSILSAFQQALQMAQIDSHHTFHAGMGLAGCEVQEAKQDFLSRSHPFQSLSLTTDAHVACLGAHAGQNGALLIAGTGSLGFQIEDQHIVQVGGWGFPHADEGSGAWLGLEVTRLTFQWLDGRAQASKLTEAVYDFFQQNTAQLVTWANRANSTAFAELAPIVIQQAETGNEDALRLLRCAARSIDQIAETLLLKQRQQNNPLPICFAGGVSTFLQPFLSEKTRARLTQPKASASEGAIYFLKRGLQQ